MASYQDLKQRYDQIKQVLASGADATLRAITGVRHTCVALKVLGDFVTDTQCIRVYVREKLPDDQVPPEDLIPPTIGGVDTDVVVVKPFELTVDTAKYRPLKGGIMISNMIVGKNEAGTDQTMGVGTLGCMATLIGNGKPVLLTNAHILRASGGKKGDAIYQPAQLTFPQFRLEDLPQRIGKKDDRIAFFTDSVLNNRIDAAIARLDVSSCCRCCGLDFRNEIVGLSDGGKPPSNKILGQRPALPGQKVFKVGISTGRTVGKVVTDDTDAFRPVSFGGEKFSFFGLIEITSDDDDNPFSLHGDSGAVIIDEDGFIVGLLSGSDGDLPPDARSYANHIAEVTSALGITINIDRSTHHSAGARVAVPRATFEFEPSAETAELYAKGKARLLGDPAGAWLWGLGDAHREEVVDLITSYRPVTVAWHRAGGPAVFAAALNTIREGGETLPTPPNGTTLEAGLTRIGDALAAHGGPELRAAIAEHREVLLNAVRDSLTLDDVLGKLRDPATLVVDA
jgi:hypothetical protein